MSGEQAKVTVKGLDASLDGISDYRIAQIRRTIIYIEQSVASALAPFAFEPNSEATWRAATEVTSRFLHDLWMQGGLIGSKASDAYTVACGLGSTMTSKDVASGMMIVVASVQIVRPAEFTVLVFEQPMQAPG